MKFCPSCRTEYTDEGIFCKECNILLVDSLPQSSDPLHQCDQCGGSIDLDTDYCPQCGTLYAEDQYSCTNHPTGVATGVCVVCQQLFCAECLTEKNGRFFCKDHAGIESREGWTVVFTSTDFYEAQIVRGLLEQNGITVQGTNTTNIGVMADGFMDNALGRTIFKYPIKLYVPASDFLAAQEVLRNE